MKRHLKVGMIGGLLLFSAMVSVSNGAPASFIEMEVKGVRLDPLGQNPVVILVDKGEKRALAIWIGPLEASAIDRELNHVTTPRPMTHDLFYSVLGKMKAKVKEVKITDLKEQTYYALIVLALDKERIEIDARPSDAIILALKSQAAISVATKVLEEQGISLTGRMSLGERSGIRVQELTPLLATQFNFKGKKGVLVSEIIAGSPAESAGLKAGDIIVKLNSKEIGKVQEFEDTFNAVKEGDPVRLTIFGEDKISEITLKMKP
jgi:bifunctional DNase/RNase